MFRIYLNPRENTEKIAELTAKSTEISEASRHAGLKTDSTECQQPVVQIGLRQLTKLLPVNGSIFVEKHAKWQPSVQIAQRLGQFRPLQTGKSHGKRQRLALQESAHRRGLVNGQSKNLDTFGRMLAREGINHRQLFNAGRTPAGPEVHQQRAPTEIGQGQFTAVGACKPLLPKILYRLGRGRAWLQPPPGQSGTSGCRSKANAPHPLTAKHGRVRWVHVGIFRHLQPRCA